MIKNESTNKQIYVIVFVAYRVQKVFNIFFNKGLLEVEIENWSKSPYFKLLFSFFKKKKLETLTERKVVPFPK